MEESFLACGGKPLTPEWSRDLQSLKLNKIPVSTEGGAVWGLLLTVMYDLMFLDSEEE